MNELNGIMRNIRKIKPSQEESFALNETNLLSQGFQGLFLIIGITGWIIGGFSILVGGFGIANIMFVSVKERTNQIGIQKALGAKNYFILLQFLIESVVLSLIGGAFGLLIIFSGTLLVAAISDFDISLNASNVILGFTISFIIGIVSGIVPSYSASKLDPVEAMRY
jgi:putative ABC transport system permease protein